MSEQLDLLSYPLKPGFKQRDTSSDAGDAIAPKAATLREQVLLAIRRKPGTPEEVALLLREDLLAIRPRFSELSAANLIEDTGCRGRSRSGRSCLVGRAR
jgi:hypothetical protein